MRRDLLILVVCGVLSACSSTPGKSTSAPIVDSADQVATAAATSGSVAATSDEATQVSGAGAKANSSVNVSALPSVASASTATENAQLLPGDQNLANETDEQKQHRIATSLAAKSIFFDYDNYSIKPEYQALVVQRAQLLISVPKLQVRLEGNADERGSREYNLALGQKRAEAVRNALLLNGVPDSSIEAISYGKEKPRAECHEERCWAMNRRVDFSESNSNASQ